MSDEYEKGFTDGQAALTKSLLSSLLCYIPDSLRPNVLLARELDDTRLVLRDLCEEFGDLDWNDDLHLADVLDKHLGRHLRTPSQGDTEVSIPGSPLLPPQENKNRRNDPPSNPRPDSSPTGQAGTTHELHPDEITDPHYGLLSDFERMAMSSLARLYTGICSNIVGDGPARAADLAEVTFHIHALQHMILSQAAARAFPEEFRLLGGEVPK